VNTSEGEDWRKVPVTFPDGRTVGVRAGSVMHHLFQQEADHQRARAEMGMMPEDPWQMSLLSDLLWRFSPKGRTLVWKYIEETFGLALKLGEPPRSLNDLVIVNHIYLRGVLRPLLQTRATEGGELDEELEFLRVALRYNGPERSSVLRNLGDNLWTEMDESDFTALGEADPHLYQELIQHLGEPMA
jgi:hypothetical protein